MMLKPCPLCGCIAEPLSGHSLGRTGYLYCIIKICNWTVYGDRDNDDLVKLWNNSTPSESQKAHFLESNSHMLKIFNKLNDLISNSRRVNNDDKT